jgi:formamidopyrimidine-DNA glycosylase
VPELPEVETIARSLRPKLLGRVIVHADVRWPRTIAEPSVRKFKEHIRGQVVQRVARRAKLLHIGLTSSSLLIHLRMSGDLSIKPGRPAPEKHDRLMLVLGLPRPHGPRPKAASGKGSGQQGPPADSLVSLVFNDTRKFGRIWLTDNPADITGRLGPEPLSRAFTPGLFRDRLHSHRRQLKPLLLDQSFLAGLGNIYTDEALHLAKLHPLRSSRSINTRQAERLHAAIRAILREGIRQNGASIDWVYRGGEFQDHFRVYNRMGEPCPECGTAIKRLVVGQRGTHICPRCQRM